MRQICCAFCVLLCATVTFAQKGSYLFIWVGDDAKAGSDLLAVLDADPDSPHYGRAVASVAVPGATGR